MESAFAFNIAFSSVTTLKKIFFACLFIWMGKEPEGQKFSISVFITAFFEQTFQDTEENVRPQGFYSVFFLQRIYSLN